MAMDEVFENILEVSRYLDDPQDEPFPNGTESDRLHYWRDKSIRAARTLRNIAGLDPIVVPEVEPTSTEKLERRIDTLTGTVGSLTGMVDRMLAIMESQRIADAARRGRFFLWEETNSQSI